LHKTETMKRKFKTSKTNQVSVILEADSFHFTSSGS